MTIRLKEYLVIWPLTTQLTNSYNSVKQGRPVAQQRQIRIWLAARGGLPKLLMDVHSFSALPFGCGRRRPGCALTFYSAFPCLLSAVLGCVEWIGLALSYSPFVTLRCVCGTLHRILWASHFGDLVFYLSALCPCLFALVSSFSMVLHWFISSSGASESVSANLMFWSRVIAPPLSRIPPQASLWIYMFFTMHSNDVQSCTTLSLFFLSHPT